MKPCSRISIIVSLATLGGAGGYWVAATLQPDTLDFLKDSKKAFAALGQKARSNDELLKNLIFADGTTSKTAIQTQDLCLDVHRNTNDPSKVTGIVQANSEATDKTVKDFVKRRSGGHRGTHQVIGEKITFSVGKAFNIEDIAGAVEKMGK